MHVFPSFGIGGVPTRTARIINHLGSRFHHIIISLDANIAAESRLASNVTAEILPLTVEKRHPIRNMIAYDQILEERRPDLLITYNWGAIEWAMLNRIRRVCRHIHQEDGFSVTEADRQLRRRVILRRFALASADRIVVPSRTLLEIATRIWKIPSERLSHIPNGIDVLRFSPRRETSGNLVPERAPDELVVGTVAPLRPEKNIARLLRAFVPVTRSFNARLIVVGEGTERARLVQLATELGIKERVMFAGNTDDPGNVLSSFDLFAISSDTEQMPNTVLEAMAAALPVIGTDVGDIRYMVAPENAALLVPKEDEAGLSSAMASLLRDSNKRRTLGELNQQRATTHYRQERMFADYQSLFQDATEN